MLGKFIDNTPKAAKIRLQNGVRRIYKDFGGVRPCIHHTLTSAFFLEFCYSSSGEQKKEENCLTWRRERRNRRINTKILHKIKTKLLLKKTNSPMCLCLCLCLCPLTTAKCGLDVQNYTIHTSRKVQNWVHILSVHGRTSALLMVLCSYAYLTSLRWAEHSA